ncbi:hypothetical protein Raf01_64290 [Rugosimonospora africana]|uniref:Uncharacterized protein n=2 Tax=Rugosimonospora africana TaxID=556532 RepID=A0A8J3QY58_9ACTN|nr:hypothetical protein Raf01_64290 [Rugosimonospora africana]
MCLHSRNGTGLTKPSRTGNLGSMAQTLQRLDPDRRRRRIRLLAELADAKAVRDRVAPRQAYVNQVRELIAARRRSARWT